MMLKKGLKDGTCILGEIDGLKMNVLARITSLMAAIPLPPDESFFKKVNRLVRSIHMER